MTDHDLTRTLAVLAQPTRFRILRVLLERPSRGLHAGEVAGAIGKGPSGTAIHLKELERVGLLASARDGNAILYVPDPTALRDLAETLGGALGLGGAAVGAEG